MLHTRLRGACPAIGLTCMLASHRTLPAPHSTIHTNAIRAVLRAGTGRADARGGHATLAALVLAATSDPSPARPLLVSSSYHTPHHTPSPHRHKRTRRSHITPNRPLYTSKSQMLPRHARRQRDHATHDPRAAAAALTERPPPPLPGLTGPASAPRPRPLPPSSCG